MARISTFLGQYVFKASLSWLLSGVFIYKGEALLSEPPWCPYILLHFFYGCFQHPCQFCLSFSIVYGL